MEPRFTARKIADVVLAIWLLVAIVATWSLSDKLAACEGKPPLAVMDGSPGASVDCSIAFLEPGIAFVNVRGATGRDEPALYLVRYTPNGTGAAPECTAWKGPPAPKGTP
jgi:hypothetical protein